MKKLIWLLAGITLLSMTACGSSGGDSLPYSGETGRADITAMGAADNFDMVAPDDYEMFFFDELLYPISGPGRSARAVFETTTVTGCNDTGYATISGTTTETSFSGTITYVGFDNCDGVIVDGTMGLSGSGNSSSETFKATFDGLTLDFDGGAEIDTIYGSMGFSYSETNTNIKINILVKEDVGGNIHMEMISGYEFDIDFDQYGDGTATVKGKFYDSDEGYIEVQTLTPVSLTDTPSYPIGGEIRFIGANGYVDAEILYNDSTYADGVLYELYNNEDTFVDDYFVPWIN
ncbi:MAG: hypothetical protein C0608_01380 [Deltaproteobacteria bacterium]|nr:MAG: hypothetical protein C0608_01380 [Deltaproteobacteria bacterium]